MKEIEKLIEAAKALAHHHAMLSSPDTRWGKKEYEDMRNSITAAESMLKRAKVFEGIVTDGALKGEPCYVQNEKTHWDSNILDGLLDKRVRVLVIPTEEDNGKK